MTVNEQTRSTATSHVPLDTTHTLYSLPSTKATDQSQTFPLIAHTSTERGVSNHGENCFTFNWKIKLYIYNDNLTFIAVVSLVLLQSAY